MTATTSHLLFCPFSAPAVHIHIRLRRLGYYSGPPLVSPAGRRPDYSPLYILVVLLSLRRVGAEVARLVTIWGLILEVFCDCSMATSAN